MIPNLETARLVLRGFQIGDFENFAGFYASDASRFVGGPEEHRVTWRRIAAYAGCWALRGYGKFVVEEKASGSAIGMVGPSFPEGRSEPEIAFTVLPEFQGRGYATEAAIRVITYVYDDLGWNTVMSAILPDNVRSVRLAERLGARHEGSLALSPNLSLEIYRYLPPAEFRAHAASLQ